MASPDGARRYEVEAVRYGTLRSLKADLFYRYGSYGEPDVEVEMAYYFWLLRDGGETIVVDMRLRSRMSARRRGRTCLCPPLEALRALGVEPEAVSTVVVTHLHYDHIGNLAAFPARDADRAAEGARLLDGTDRLALPVRVARRAARDRRSSRGRAADGRVRLTDGTEEILDGVTAIAVGGHSAGQQIPSCEAGTETSSSPRTPCTSTRSSSSSGRSRSCTTSSRCTSPTSVLKGFARRGCGGGSGARPGRRSALPAGRYGWSRLGGADRMKGRARSWDTGKETGGSP